MLTIRQLCCVDRQVAFGQLTGTISHDNARNDRVCVEVWINPDGVMGDWQILGSTMTDDFDSW